MISLILRTATRFLMPVLLLFSLFLLLRGHNEPGGGFTGVRWRRRPLRCIASRIMPPPHDRPCGSTRRP